MAASNIAKAAAVTAASVWLGGCATGRNHSAHTAPLEAEATAQHPAQSSPNAVQPRSAAQPGILAEIPDLKEAPSSNPLSDISDRPGTNAMGNALYVENLFSTEYAKLFYQDTKQVFTAPFRWRTKEWLTLGVLGGTVAGLTFADESIQEWSQSHRANPSDQFAKNVAPLGATFSAGILGSFYVVGAIWDKPKARAVAQDGLSASIINSFMIMPIMKLTVGRARPDQDHGSKEYDPFCLTQSSMPSGHTAQAFTVASVISAHYESWWVRGAAYGAASLVGWARVHQDRHFTSDCVAGAIVGTFVGHTVARYNQRYRAERGERRTTFSPFYDGEAVGLALDYKF